MHTRTSSPSSTRLLAIASIPAIPVAAEREGLTLAGFAALPTYSRGAAVSQHLFVNGRPANEYFPREALVGLVNQPLAERPLRLPVGDDFKGACDAINTVASQTTEGAYKHMQLNTLLTVKQ